MPTRRQFLLFGLTTLAAAPALAWVTSPGRSSRDDRSFPLQRSDGEWQARLSPLQYRVLRHGATERAFSSPLDEERRPGMYLCAGCAHPVFSSSTKFDSGTGWPSFWQPLDAAVATSVDTSWFMVRTEVHCATCGGHLGHVFADGPRPTGLRYCMNGAALSFVRS